MKRLNTKGIIIKQPNRKEFLNNCLKSKNKELRYEVLGNLENLKKQAARLQKFLAENETLKKGFVITNQQLVSWKMIKHKKLNLNHHS